MKMAIGSLTLIGLPGSRGEQTAGLCMRLTLAVLHVVGPSLQALDRHAHSGLHGCRLLKRVLNQHVGAPGRRKRVASLCMHAR